MGTCVTAGERDSQQEFALGLLGLRPGLSNHLEEWDGRGGGGMVKREGHRQTYGDSCWCLVETNTILQSSSASVENKYIFLNGHNIYLILSVSVVLFIFYS